METLINYKKKAVYMFTFFLQSMKKRDFEFPELRVLNESFYL